ncbi:hypothetical protein F0562_003253 [Nyssa sinensis]|uniref:C2 domain-containing protein n=1 Tax=Nyssa sinensis TaxID=561372 RepID=A0A5J5BUM9_9ASTE|nr:hypothetical protein F0562_003253 [Nyssa sinensis]
MGAPQSLSSLSCELRIIRAKNMEFKSVGYLFVRCYLSAGNSTRVQLNSREISSKSNLFWNESFSLQCLGTKDSRDMLIKGRVVFELCWRSTVPVLGRIVDVFMKMSSLPAAASSDEGSSSRKDRDLEEEEETWKVGKVE